VTASLRTVLVAVSSVRTKDLRLHLRALHCWEQDWIDGCTDEELKAQHLEAHDNAEKWEGIFNLHRIAYPHTYYDRRTVRP
jgi:hypothetical protein